MDKDTLCKVQKVQLEIAKEIKRVCEENNIDYWLDYGSLLGAVRHKGFIPWDDDLDIGMTRENYERFLSVADSSLDSQYHLQEWSRDSHYGLPFAKVRKNGTKFVEVKSPKKQFDNGIFVDIFPYDHFGNSMRKQGLPIKLIKLIVQNKAGNRAWREEDGINVGKLIQHIPFILISRFFNKEKLVRKYHTIATLYNDKPCEYYFPQGIKKYGKWLIPCSAIEELIEVQFEDCVFTIPTGYDSYLTNVYGEYLKLPPEDQRENRHQIIELKF